MYLSAASNSTMADWFNRVASTELRAINAARASAREAAWSDGAGPKRSALTIDIDATLISATDTKAETGPNFKGGYGFHPLMAVCAVTGEVFDSILRPGNAGANSAADHVELLDRVLDSHLPARDRDRKRRKGSYILEITDLVDLNLPKGTRGIARRERPHPGAQLSVFDDINGWRHQVFITNSNGWPAGLERRHRQRGTAESVIRGLEAFGATNLPFTDVLSNQANTSSSPCAPLMCWPGPEPSRCTGPASPEPPPRPSAAGYCTSAAGSPQRDEPSTSTEPGPGPDSYSKPSNGSPNGSNDHSQ